MIGESPVIYLYGVTSAGAALPDCAGIEDAPLELLEAGQLAAVCSIHERLECRPDPDALWRHEQVAEGLMESVTPLPARFGTTFADRAILVRTLTEAEPRLSAQLERVRGCVELAVRVRAPTREQPEPSSGREYVKAALERARDRESIARLLSPLEALAVSVRRLARAADCGVLSVSYLVRARDVPAFAEAVRALQREDRNLLLSCTGPWAPYSFAGWEGS